MAEKDEPRGRRARTKSALLEAAAKVFVARGYEAAALDEIAAMAGFTRGAIYSSFADKEELFLAVVTTINEKWIASFVPAFREMAASELSSSKLSASKTISTLWTAFASSDEQQSRLMLEFRVVALRNPSVADRLADFEKRMEETMAAIVRDLMDSGILHSALPPDELAVLMYSASQGILLHQLACRSPHSDIFNNLVQVALAAQPDPPGGRRPRRPARG